MASVRPIPESYYYSGQGRLGIGDRDPATGKFSNVIFPGNVTSLTIDISTDKTEHKESMTGQRAVDRTIITSKNATFAFTAESLDKRLMQVGLFGSLNEIEAGTVTAEQHKVGAEGSAIILDHQNVSAIVITTVPGTGSPATLDEVGEDGEGDYTVDNGFGTIYLTADGLVKAAAGSTVSFAYSYGPASRLEAFTEATPPQRYLRFEGLNTDNGDLVLLEIPIAAFDPVTGREYINEEFGTAEFAGNILPDSKITGSGLSQYFRETRIAAADIVEE